jgi:type I restriction enzyme S subunit
MALDDLDTEAVDFDYLAFCLVHFGVEEAISGSAQPQITKASLKSPKFPFPPPSRTATHR